MTVLTARSQQLGASSGIVPDALGRYPLSVYRLSHLVTNKFLTHGSRCTVNGQRTSGLPMPSTPPAARSQQPEAILRLITKAEHALFPLPHSLFLFPETRKREDCNFGTLSAPVFARRV